MCCLRCALRAARELSAKVTIAATTEKNATIEPEADRKAVYLSEDWSGKLTYAEDMLCTASGNNAAAKMQRIQNDKSVASAMKVKRSTAG